MISSVNNTFNFPNHNKKRVTINIDYDELVRPLLDQEFSNWQNDI